jgi:hypothetical protein
MTTSSLPSLVKSVATTSGESKPDVFGKWTGAFNYRWNPANFVEFVDPVGSFCCDTFAPELCPMSSHHSLRRRFGTMRHDQQL